MGHNGLESVRSMVEMFDYLEIGTFKSVFRLTIQVSVHGEAL
jgi:hypothetical protein